MRSAGSEKLFGKRQLGPDLEGQPRLRADARRLGVHVPQDVVDDEENGKAARQARYLDLGGQRLCHVK